MAADYNRNALHVSAPHFAAYVADLVDPGETVLAIGSGTGGFTLPVAAPASRMLALDPSEAMLAVLRHELVARALGNVALMQAEWPHSWPGAAPEG